LGVRQTDLVKTRRMVTSRVTVMLYTFAVSLERRDSESSAIVHIGVSMTIYGTVQFPRREKTCARIARGRGELVSRTMLLIP
jgi:hypothetical protein